MENAFLILLLLAVWFELHNKISRSLLKTDELKNEIAELKKLLSSHSVVKETEEITPELQEPSPEPQPVAPSAPVEEEYHIPILSVEIREEKEVVSPSVKPPKAKKAINYEKYIGENLFGKIGILILVVGMGLFVKYAIDNDWINEVFRTILGFAVGVGLLLLAGKLKDGYRTFSSLLAGGAFAIFYVTVAIAFHYYGLFSQTAAFILLVVLTVLMSAMAVGYNRRELAVIALVGGFIAPFLVSNGMGSYLVLFIYVMILDIGMFVLSLYKKWGELPVICFVLTWLVLLGYALATDLDLMAVNPLIHLLLFSVAFYLIFQFTVASIVRINGRKINQLLLGVIAVDNFVFLFFALWFLRTMNLDMNYNGMVTLFVAIVNIAIFFWVQKKGESYRFLLHTLLGIAILFVSVTIPIQLKGTFITLFWASEMMIIGWFYTRFREKVYEVFSVLLPVLTFVSYLLDVKSALINWDITREGVLFLNATFATGIFTGLAFLVCTRLLRLTGKGNAGAIFAACFILYSSFILDFFVYIEPWIDFVSYAQVFTTTVLLGLTWLLRSRFPVSSHAGKYLFVLAVSTGLFALYSWIVNGDYEGFLPYIIQWVSFLGLIAHIVCTARLYYTAFDFRTKRTNGVTCFLSVISTLVWMIAINNGLYQLGWTEEVNAGYSISLSMAGFAQMALGMRLHLKVLRVISLATFGLVLLKLVVVDLWLLPTIGKVIVFIILGVILLVLSFLYQKLKAVLVDEK